MNIYESLKDTRAVIDSLLTDAPLEFASIPIPNQLSMHSCRKTAYRVSNPLNLDYNRPRLRGSYKTQKGWDFEFPYLCFWSPLNEVRLGHLAFR